MILKIFSNLGDSMKVCLYCNDPTECLHHLKIDPRSSQDNFFPPSFPRTLGLPQLYLVA